MGRLKEVAGVSLLFLGTSCGITTTPTPKPSQEIIPSLPETPPTLAIPEKTAVIATPRPVPAFTSEVAREKILDDIKALVQVLQDYVHPQIAEPLNSLYFDRLSRSTDRTIIDFLDSARYGPDVRSGSQYLIRWRLSTASGNGQLSVAFNPRRDNRGSIIDIAEFEIDLFILPRFWPNMDYLTMPTGKEDEDGNEYRRIRPERMQEAARTIFNLPADVRWVTVPEPEIGSLSHGGLVGRSILPDGAYQEVRMTDFGWASLAVNRPSTRGFPIG